MIINKKSLLSLAPIKNMENCKLIANGTTFGLSEAGYDIRIKQSIDFGTDGSITITDPVSGIPITYQNTKFTLASAIEEFDMPSNLIGRVHDKSTWARRGLSVFNTVVEPSWKGFLTLELVYHGSSSLYIPSGSGIAQVVFDEISDDAVYSGKYQNQPDEPTTAKESV